MSRYESDTCGRSYTIRIRYVWTQIFLYPHKKILGYKNLRIRVDGALVPTRKAIWYRHRTGTSLSRTSCPSGWPGGFGERNPNPHSWIFTFISLDPSPRSYLFTSATVPIPVHIAPKCGTEPIRYVTLHFRDQRGEASLRYRSRAEITVLRCQQEPHALLARSIRYRVNITWLNRGASHSLYDC